MAKTAVTEMEDAPEEIVIEFKSPIVKSGKTFDSITLRVPTVEQYDNAMTKGKDNIIAICCHLISSVSGVEMPVIRAMEMPDFNKANKFFQPFLV